MHPTLTCALAVLATAALNVHAGPATVYVLPEPPTTTRPPTQARTHGRHTPPAGSCQGPAGTPPAARVRVGGGYLADTSFTNLSQLMWVGPECTHVFTGSPTHVQHQGAWIAATDYFGATTYNDTKPIFRSDDGGINWRLVANVTGIYWANLFAVGDDLYLMGTQGDDLHKVPPGLPDACVGRWRVRQALLARRFDAFFALAGGARSRWRVRQALLARRFSELTATASLASLVFAPPMQVSPPNKEPMKGGPVVLSRSIDGGHSWSTPSVVLRGSYQTGPTPMATLNGVIYRTMEDSSVGVGALVMWARTTDDLLDASSWQHSAPLTAPPAPADGRRRDWQEGNALVAPSGEIWNVLRVNGQTAAFHNVVGIAVLDTKTRSLSFKQYASGPFGPSKFHILRDGDGDGDGDGGTGSGAQPAAAYYALSTNVTDAAAAAGIYGARNNLVLSKSLNLVDWTVCERVLYDDTGLSFNDSAKYVGKQERDKKNVGG